MQPCFQAPISNNCYFKPLPRKEKTSVHQLAWGNCSIGKGNTVHNLVSAWASTLTAASEDIFNYCFEKQNNRPGKSIPYWYPLLSWLKNILCQLSTLGMPINYSCSQSRIKTFLGVVNTGDLLTLSFFTPFGKFHSCIQILSYMLRDEAAYSYFLGGNHTSMSDFTCLNKQQICQPSL